MNLTIDPTKIAAIRIGGTWTDITSLTVGDLGYQAIGIANYRIGPGFQATDTDGYTIAGPLSAITAVKLHPETAEATP